MRSCATTASSSPKNSPTSKSLSSNHSSISDLSVNSSAKKGIFTDINNYASSETNLICPYMSLCSENAKEQDFMSFLLDRTLSLYKKIIKLLWEAKN